MNRKGWMKFSGIAIGSVFLVLFILLTLKPVSPGTSRCAILPTLPGVEYPIYGRGCGWVVAECPIFVDKNGDGNYKDWVQDNETGKWHWVWDPDERPGVAGCDCAEQTCNNWCALDVCIWSSKIIVSAAVCHVSTAMGHCIGAYICPTETGTAPCSGEGCGYVPAGGCCLKDSDCITYYPGGPSKCIIQTYDCYSWEGYAEHAEKLTENLGYACDCSNLNEPCGTSIDCCDNDHDGNPDYECVDSICKLPV